jgi:hypothetical protein
MLALRSGEVRLGRPLLLLVLLLLSLASASPCVLTLWSRMVWGARAAPTAAWSAAGRVTRSSEQWDPEETLLLATWLLTAPAASLGPAAAAAATACLGESHALGRSSLGGASAKLMGGTAACRGPGLGRGTRGKALASLSSKCLPCRLPGSTELAGAPPNPVTASVPDRGAPIMPCLLLSCCCCCLCCCCW